MSMTLSRKRTAVRHALLDLRQIQGGGGRKRLGDELREIDRAEEAGAVGRQRLLTAIVRLKAIGVESVDTGDFHVVDIFDAKLRRRTLRVADEALAVGRALVIGDRSVETCGLFTVGESERAR